MNGDELVSTGGRFVMRKRCPQHGAEEVVVSSSAAWYDQ